MYDDLARAQKPSPLEWLVVNMVIPSMLVTYALQLRLDGEPRIKPRPEYVLIGCQLRMLDEPNPGFPTHVAGWAGALDQARPELLTGPLPAYPDLLRQAGIQGQVVLEAVVDTTGRVQAASISVVLATNPGFVEPARHALRATLFRPARVNGRAVSMLVRVPFTFSIRGGTGRAR